MQLATRRFLTALSVSSLIHVLAIAPCASAQDEPKPLIQRLKEFGKDRLLKEPFAGAPEDTPKGLAAKIRAEELDVKNRVRAAEYLGKVDCIAYPEAQETLVDMILNDKYEKVRLAAAEALEEMLSHGRNKADKRLAERGRADRYDICRGCCNDKVLNSLAKVAYDTDEHGCCFEPSARVREAAKAAIAACGVCCNGYYSMEGAPTIAPMPDPVPGGGEEPVDVPVEEPESNQKQKEPESKYRIGAVESAKAPTFPVSYLTSDVNYLPAIRVLNGKCIVGLKSRRFEPVDPDVFSTYRNRYYYFANAEAKAEFDAEPEKFAVAYAGIDPVHFVNHQEAVEGSFLREFDGRFYLFHTKENWNAFKQNPELYLPTN